MIDVIILVFLETLFCFICIKAAKGKLSVWRNAGLFFGIIACTFLSGLLLRGHVFRYFLILALIFGLIKLIYGKQTRYYDLFVVIIILAVNFIVHFVFIMAIGGVDGFTSTHRFALGIVPVTLAVLLAKLKVIQKLYSLLRQSLSSGERFYLRYCLSICFVLTVLVYLKSLVRYLEVGYLAPWWRMLF